MSSRRPSFLFIVVGTIVVVVVVVVVAIVVAGWWSAVDSTFSVLAADSAVSSKFVCACGVILVSWAFAGAGGTGMGLVVS